jgi:hypothetical protein
MRDLLEDYTIVEAQVFKQIVGLFISLALHLLFTQSWIARGVPENLSAPSKL